ncbi:hypothetical protein J5N97_026451 [Dioscorea zingiberensis]|uniref:Gag protein n=1 Tax=Dioscorea zingiberensis TaxID=325984 RepID=A0A9D5H6P9_9LILI|nr:hypothetical protein J5N97_026451 [Dioscorea zingiberensis]
MNLTIQLQHQTKGNLTMISYLDKIKSLADNLLAVASLVSDEDLILHTLNGLPSSYSAFKTAIRTRAASITIEELWTFLLSEEVNQMREAQLVSLMAMAATTTPLSFNHQGGRGGRGGHGGHSQRGTARGGGCHPLPTFRGVSFSQGQIICQICSRPNHSALDCWYRYNAPQQPLSSSAPLLPTPTSNALTISTNPTAPDST